MMKRYIFQAANGDITFMMDGLVAELVNPR